MALIAVAGSTAALACVKGGGVALLGVVGRAGAGLQVSAKGMGNVAEMVILCLFPWCFTQELYAAKPDYIQNLAAFVRSRPAQSVASFISQSNAVATLTITFGWAFTAGGGEW